MLDFTGSDFIEYGDTYPRYDDDNDDVNVTQLLFVVKADKDNYLCADGSRYDESGARRKRSEFDQYLNIWAEKKKELKR